MSAFRIKRRNKRNQRQPAPSPQPSQQQQQPQQPNPVAPLTKPAPNRPYDFDAAQKRYEATCLEFDSQPFDDEDEEQEYTKDELFEAIKKKYLAAGPRPSSPPTAPPAKPAAPAPLQQPPPPQPPVPAQAAAPGHSTGPRTPAGKSRASMNAFLHGLASTPGRAITFLPHEDPNEHAQLTVQFTQQFVPLTDAEHQIIREIVDLLWLARRARDLQAFALESEDDRKLALYLRYETAHLRAHNAAIKNLLTLQKDRRQRDQHHEKWGEPARPADFTFISTPAKATAPPQSLTTTTTSTPDTSFRNPSSAPQNPPLTQPETTPQPAFGLAQKEENRAA